MPFRAPRAAALLLFVLELILYSGLVSGYVLLVLHFLGAWLKHLFDVDRGVYAVMALVLIVAQGLLLEMVTGALVRPLRGKSD
jgi:hypothetical protein